ncbi:MAG: nitroreductase family protein [bacterium]
MEFQEIVRQRYATKLFDGRAVPEAKVAELLELVRWAPSGLNIQPWKIKIVADAATKALLSAATFAEPQIESCSHLLVFCADTDFAGLSKKLDLAMKDRDIPDEVWDIVMGIAGEMAGMPPEELRAWTSCQVYIAVTYAILGAKTLGLDSCPMTHFVPQEYARILGLPANLVPTVLCPIGYAADQPKPKWRYPVEDLLIS